MESRYFTGGVRLGRARRQWSRSHPFPFPLPGGMLGEEKAKVKQISSLLVGQFEKWCVSVRFEFGHWSTTPFASPSPKATNP
jgi:hypothetical protein